MHRRLQRVPEPNAHNGTVSQSRNTADQVTRVIGFRQTGGSVGGNQRGSLAATVGCRAQATETVDNAATTIPAHITTGALGLQVRMLRWHCLYKSKKCMRSSFVA